MGGAPRAADGVKARRRGESLLRLGYEAIIVCPYRISPTAGGSPRSLCHEEWGRNPGGRSQTVEIIQILLIGEEGRRLSFLPRGEDLDFL